MTGDPRSGLPTLLLEHNSRGHYASGRTWVPGFPIVDGRVHIEIRKESVELCSGDLMSLPAHRPHHIRSIDGPARIVGIHQYPRGRPCPDVAASDVKALE